MRTVSVQVIHDLAIKHRTPEDRHIRIASVDNPDVPGHPLCKQSGLKPSTTWWMMIKMRLEGEPNVTCTACKMSRIYFDKHMYRAAIYKAFTSVLDAEKYSWSFDTKGNKHRS